MTAQFLMLANNGKLEPLSKYLPSDKSAQPETLDEVMGKWNALVAAGYPIQVKEVTHGD